MRGAAHNFVRFMTAGMALITCHEPVLISIVNNLKTMLASALRVSVSIQLYPNYNHIDFSLSSLWFFYIFLCLDFLITDSFTTAKGYD